MQRKRGIALVARLDRNIDYNVTWAIQGPLQIYIKSKWTWVLGLVLSTIASPIVLWQLIANPVVFRRGKHGDFEIRNYDVLTRGAGRSDYYVFCDLRIVFALQLAAVIAVVAGLVLLNAAGLA